MQRLKWAALPAALDAAARLPAPPSLVLLCDGFDSAVLRGVQTTGASRIQLLAHLLDTSTILVSTECNSWPRCYESAYEEDSEYKRCRALPSSSCFPNVGALLAPPSALRHLASIIQPMVAAGVDDQDAIHLAFLTRRHTGLKMRLDGDANMMLSLSPCPLHPRFPRLFHCPTAPFDPLPLLSTRTPLLVHAAGIGKGLLSTLPINQTRARHTPIHLLVTDGSTGGTHHRQRLRSSDAASLFDGEGMATAVRRALSVSNPMPQPPVRAYYLNLARRTERRLRIEGLLTTLGLSAHGERVDAVDGTTLVRSSPSAFARACRDAIAPRVLHQLTRRASNPDLAGVDGQGLEPGTRRWVLGVHVTSGAAALLATTYSLLDRLRARTSGVALILEDDATLAPGTVDTTAITRLLHDLAACTDRTSMPCEPWDVVLLGYHGGWRGRPADLGAVRANLTSTFDIRRVTGYAFGLFAYALNLASVPTLINAVFPASTQLDSAYLDANAKDRLRVLAVTKPLLTSVPSRPEETDIQRLPPRRHGG